MNKTNLAEDILEKYRLGQHYFENLDLENENFNGQNLEGIVFEYCALYMSFRATNLQNAKLLNSGIKTCDFREADLTNARFENVCVESNQFARAKTGGVYFDNNSAFS